MRRTRFLLLAGLSLALAVPAFLSAQEYWIGPECIPDLGKPIKPQVRLVEIQGTIRHEVGKEDPTWHYATPTGLRVTLDGVTYHLAFKDDALRLIATARLGERVVLTGRLEQRTIGAGRRGKPGEPVFQDARLFAETWVHVTDVRPVAADGVKETQVIEIRGKLDMHCQPGFPQREEVAVIEVGGKWYVLNFHDYKALEERAGKLDGKTVLIRGTKGNDRTFSVLCQGPLTLPSIDVTGLEAPGVKLSVIELYGEFDLVRSLPHQFTANGIRYWLDFGKNDELRRMAERLKDRHATVRGVLIEGESPAWLPTVLVSDVRHDPDYVVWLEAR